MEFVTNEKLTIVGACRNDWIEHGSNCYHDGSYSQYLFV